MNKKLRTFLMVLCIVLFIIFIACACITTKIPGFDLNTFSIIMAIVSAGGFFVCIFDKLP